MSFWVTRSQSGYEVRHTDPAAEPWIGPPSMTPAQVLSELSVRGYHSTDVTDALDDADLRWVEAGHDVHPTWIERLAETHTALTDHEWSSFRKSVRRRLAAQVMLIIGPLIIVGAVFNALKSHGVYPPGDARNEQSFWIGLGAFFVVFAAILIVLSIRELRTHR